MRIFSVKKKNPYSLVGDSPMRTPLHRGFPYGQLGEFFA